MRDWNTGLRNWKHPLRFSKSVYCNSYFNLLKAVLTAFHTVTVIILHRYFNGPRNLVYIGFFSQMRKFEGKERKRKKRRKKKRRSNSRFPPLWNCRGQSAVYLVICLRIRSGREACKPWGGFEISRFPSAVYDCRRPIQPVCLLCLYLRWTKSTTPAMWATSSRTVSWLVSGGSRFNSILQVMLNRWV